MYCGRCRYLTHVIFYLVAFGKFLPIRPSILKKPELWCDDIIAIIRSRRDTGCRCEFKIWQKTTFVADVLYEKQSVPYIAALFMITIIAWKIKAVTDTIFHSTCLFPLIQVTNQTKITS